MGRTECDLWYEKVDFRDKSVLIIEWTHGNSDYYDGVDIPIFLNSTPKETLIYRAIRSRDGKVDSPFTMRVLEIEQQLIDSQAHKAKIIISKSGELLTFDEYKTLLE
jgi:alpha-galactosidase